MNKERDITAASYIYQFYVQIQSLNHEFSNYLNINLEVENKCGRDVKKASKEDLNAIKIQSQKVRYYVYQTYIHYTSIIKAIKKSVDDKIKNEYDLIKNDFIIDREELESYVTLINSVLIGEVIKNLLENSQDLIQEIYQNADTKPAT